jgi:hypothetical protein
MVGVFVLLEFSLDSEKEQRREWIKGTSLLRNCF